MAAFSAVENRFPGNNMSELITQVNALLKEVAQQAVLPQYRALHSGQIQEKEPSDYVTAADLASEVMLKKGLLLAPDEASWNVLHHTLFGDQYAS